MSDIPKKDSQVPPAASNDDEDIIELVEEIGEESPEHALSDLERNLLDLDDKGHTADRSLPELPDISDLSLIDFEEEETEAPGEGPPPAEAGTEGASLTADAARLFEPDAEGDSAAAEKRPAAPLDEIEEISEFDEQFLEADELLEGLPAPPEDASSGEDEDLELLEIEEDDTDDEIVWFDDLDKPDQEAPPVTPAPEDVPPEAPILETQTESILEPSAADVFAAHVESGRADADTGTRLAAIAAGAGAALAAAAEVPPVQPAGEYPPGIRPPDAVDAGPAAVPGLTPEEIEAAVERVISRKLGGTIEAIILQAIEKAVSKEIERLKRLLLDEEAGDRMP